MGETCERCGDPPFLGGCEHCQPTDDETRPAAMGERKWYDPIAEVPTFDLHSSLVGACMERSKDGTGDYVSSDDYNKIASALDAERAECERLRMTTANLLAERHAEIAALRERVAGLTRKCRNVDSDYQCSIEREGRQRARVSELERACVVHCHNASGGEIQVCGVCDAEGFRSEPWDGPWHEGNCRLRASEEDAP